VPADQRADPRLHGQQQAGRQHQERHHHVERALRGGQQQHAAGHRAGGGDRAERDQPGPLAGQLAAEAVHAAEVAGPQRDGVRHVRGEGAVADGDQRREQQQRPAAGDRVHRAGDQPGTRGQERVGDLHPLF
jgi:hypothetical protein